MTKKHKVLSMYRVSPKTWELIDDFKIVFIKDFLFSIQVKQYCSRHDPKNNIVQDTILKQYCSRHDPKNNIVQNTILKQYCSRHDTETILFKTRSWRNNIVQDTILKKILFKTRSWNNIVQNTILKKQYCSRHPGRCLLTSFHKCNLVYRSLTSDRIFFVIKDCSSRIQRFLSIKNIWPWKNVRIDIFSIFLHCNILISYLLIV